MSKKKIYTASQYNSVVNSKNRLQRKLTKKDKELTVLKSNTNFGSNVIKKVYNHCVELSEDAEQDIKKGADDSEYLQCCVIKDVCDEILDMIDKEYEKTNSSFIKNVFMWSFGRLLSSFIPLNIFD